MDESREMEMRDTTRKTKSGNGYGTGIQGSGELWGGTETAPLSRKFPHYRTFLLHIDANLCIDCVQKVEINMEQQFTVVGRNSGK